MRELIQVNLDYELEWEYNIQSFLFSEGSHQKVEAIIALEIANHGEHHDTAQKWKIRLFWMRKYGSGWKLRVWRQAWNCVRLYFQGRLFACLLRARSAVYKTVAVLSVQTDTQII